MAQWREGYYRIPPKAAGGEGGEGGEGACSWEMEADYSADVDDMIITGNRVRFLFGGPGQGTTAMWYGALVGVVGDEEAEFAFDDGDYRVFKKEDLQRFAEARTLASWPSARFCAWAAWRPGRERDRVRRGCRVHPPQGQGRFEDSWPTGGAYGRS